MRSFHEDFLRKVFNMHPKKEKVLAKLTPEEVARFMELNARRKAFVFGSERVASKLNAENARLWADLSDKYNFHGKDVTYREETGELVQMGE